jgi:hypothetical protein
MWEPRRLTTLWAFTAYYRDSFYLTVYNYNVQMKEDEMYGACSTHEREEHSTITVGKSEGKSHREDLGVDKRIILKG